MEWCAPRSVESLCWTSCHGYGWLVLELYGGEPAERGVPEAAVVEDLEVVEHRVRELEPGAPAAAGRGVRLRAGAGGGGGVGGGVAGCATPPCAGSRRVRQRRRSRSSTCMRDQKDSMTALS